MKQTAVDWLSKKTFIPVYLLEQAKEMEEKQHSDTFLAGGRSAFNAAKGRDFTTFEDYYNKTFKSE